jgi:uncharacterized membrane protein
MMQKLTLLEDVVEFFVFSYTIVKIEEDRNKYLAASLTGCITPL